MKHATTIRSLASLAFLSLATACASIDVEDMVPEVSSYGAQHPATVGLDVGGGSSAVKWYSGTIEREEIEDAVRLSIEATRLFSGVVDLAVADYALAVDLTYAGSHPGFTMNAWVNLQWSLVQQETGNTIWSEETEGAGKATVGEAFDGTARQYLALERGAQRAIELALTEVGKLDL